MQSTLLKRDNFIEKRLQCPVQEITCEFCEIPKKISFTENHRTTASGNEHGKSLVFWRKSLRNASFLTRRMLYFNSSYIFVKSSKKMSLLHTIRLYLAGFHIFLKECLAGLQEDEINVSKTSRILSIRTV